MFCSEYCDKPYENNFCTYTIIPAKKKLLLQNPGNFLYYMYATDFG